MARKRNALFAGLVGERKKSVARDAIVDLHEVRAAFLDFVDYPACVAGLMNDDGARPGGGIAVHDGAADENIGRDRTEANLARDSLVFFEPNIRRTPVTPFAT